LLARHQWWGGGGNDSQKVFGAKGGGARKPGVGLIGGDAFGLFHDPPGFAFLSVGGGAGAENSDPRAKKAYLKKKTRAPSKFFFFGPRCRHEVWKGGGLTESGERGREFFARRAFFEKKKKNKKKKKKKGRGLYHSAPGRPHGGFFINKVVLCFFRGFGCVWEKKKQKNNRMSRGGSGKTFLRGNFGGFSGRLVNDPKTKQPRKPPWGGKDLNKFFFIVF